MPSRKSAWIDVTIPFANGMHSWPGNPPTVIKPHAALAKGDVCNVSVFNLNTHAGTHMDSPWHFLKGLGTMDDLPFEAVIGPCRVVEIKDQESIKPAELAKLKLKKGERILFRTRGRARGQAVPTRSLNQKPHHSGQFRFSTPKVRPDPIGDSIESPQ